MEVKDLAKQLFQGPPKAKGEVDLRIDLGTPSMKNMAAFLSHLFMEGMNLLYGDKETGKVKICELTEKQFEKLRLHMESIGFTVHFDSCPAENRNKKILEIGSNDSKDLSYWVCTLTEYNVCYFLYFEFIV